MQQQTILPFLPKDAFQEWRERLIPDFLLLHKDHSAVRGGLVARAQIHFHSVESGLAAARPDIVKMMHKLVALRKIKAE
jgi:hypothetical protein